VPQPETAAAQSNPTNAVRILNPPNTPGNHHSTITRTQAILGAIQQSPHSDTDIKLATEIAEWASVN